METITIDNKKFYALGINYKKADATIRGLFSLNNEAKTALLQEAKRRGIEMIAISTCNRTEVYGFAQHPFKIIDLLCKYSNGTVEQFKNNFFIYKSNDAIHHLFRMASGLESQILGDVEILGQLKKDCALAKELGTMNPFLERLTNAAVQTSKKIKNETNLSNGAASVSFVAVQWIRENFKDYTTKKIVLFGVGEIGKNTCENLVKHTENKSIVLINRTQEKARKLAFKYQVENKNFSELKNEIAKTDILIVATNSNQPTITPDLIPKGKKLSIIDLSMPRNAAISLKDNPNINLIHIDELSLLVDASLKERKKEIPKAEHILEEIESAFLEWHEKRKLAPAIQSFKEKLQEIHAHEIDNYKRKNKTINESHQIHLEQYTNSLIQQITKQYVNHLKERPHIATDSINIISTMFNIN